MKRETILILVLSMLILNLNLISPQVCASDNEITVFCGLTDTPAPTQQTQEQSLTDNSYQTLGIIIFLILISLLSIAGILTYKKVKKNG